MTKREQAQATRKRIRFLFMAGASICQLSRKWGRSVVERAIREGLR